MARTEFDPDGPPPMTAPYADRTLLGRLPEADVCLDDITVSRRHTEVLAHEGGHMIRDAGSLDGTYVNGERIDATVLRAGDHVQIGKYRLTYHPGPHQSDNGRNERKES